VKAVRSLGASRRAERVEHAELLAVHDLVDQATYGGLVRGHEERCLTGGATGTGPSAASRHDARRRRRTAIHAAAPAATTAAAMTPNQTVPITPSAPSPPRKARTGPAQHAAQATAPTPTIPNGLRSAVVTWRGVPGLNPLRRAISAILSVVATPSTVELQPDLKVKGTGTISRYAIVPK